eukprot:scaffold11358_cov90-Isochrysis_galbana.AAC.2
MARPGLLLHGPSRAPRACWRRRWTAPSATGVLPFRPLPEKRRDGLEGDELVGQGARPFASPSEKLCLALQLGKRALLVLGLHAREKRLRLLRDERRRLSLGF